MELRKREAVGSQIEVKMVFGFFMVAKSFILVTVGSRNRLRTTELALTLP